MASKTFNQEVKYSEAQTETTEIVKMDYDTKEYDGKEGFELKKIEPTADLFKETTRANSTLYDDYNFRPYNPDELYQKTGNYDYFDEMKEDDQIAASLHLKKLMITDSDFEIFFEGDDIPEEQQEEITDFIMKNLNSLDKPFSSKLYDILSGIEYGFSLTEPVFAVKPFEGKDKIWLDKMKTRAPHGFTLVQEENGDLKEILQDQGGEEKSIRPEKLIHYINQGEFDNPYGKSELNKGVYTSWWSKEQIVKFWNIFLEKFGSPTPIGKYGANYAGKQDKLLSVLKNIQATSAIVIPEGVDISVLEKHADGGGDQFKQRIDHANMMIARKMLLPDLMGMSGEATSGGSFALGKEHFGMFWSVVESVQSALEMLINTKIVDNLVAWNYGDFRVKFKFKKADDEKRQKNLELFLQFINTAGIISPEHRKWFNQQIDAPIEETLPEEDPNQEEDPENPDDPNDPDEESEGKPDGDEEETPDKEDAPDEEEDEKEELTQKKKAELYAKFDPNKIKSDFDNLERSLTSKLRTATQRQVRDILEQVDTIEFIDQIDDIDVSIDETADLIGTHVERSFEKGTVSVTKQQNFTLSDEEIKAWFDNYNFDLATEEANYLLRVSKPIVADGLRNGDSNIKIKRMIRDTLAKGNVLNNRINTLVRTATSTAYNEARIRQFEEIEDEIIAYEFDAILDHRTSPICNHFDGMQFKVGDGRTVNPPLHFNCRSVLRALTRGDEAERKDRLDKVPNSVPVQKADGRIVNKPLERQGNFFVVKTKK